VSLIAIKIFNRIAALIHSYCLLSVVFDVVFHGTCCVVNEMFVSVVKPDLKVYRARFSEITPQ